MFKALTLLASLVGVSAFVAPSARPAARSALQMADFSKEIGKSKFSQCNFLKLRMNKIE